MGTRVGAARTIMPARTDRSASFDAGRLHRLSKKLHSLLEGYGPEIA
jgi:hypothetical protein